MVKMSAKGSSVDVTILSTYDHVYFLIFEL